MGKMQRWKATKKDGSTVEFEAPTGFDFEAALRYAGMASFEVTSVTVIS